MISLKDYNDLLEDMEIGETRRFNHLGCKAGTDSRRRLYVSRTDNSPGMLLAYCHNCGDDGARSYAGGLKFRFGGKVPVKKASQTESNKIVVPPNLDLNVSQWPLEAVSTLHTLAKDIDDEVHTHLDVGYNAADHRLYWPMAEDVVKGGKITFAVPDLKGMQSRRCLGGGGQKYLKSVSRSFQGYTFLEGEDKLVVIVEDIFSAIKCNKAGFNAMCLYGVHASPESLYKVMSKSNKAVVWLDNDSDFILERAYKIKKYIQLMNKEVWVQETGIDPKHYMVSTIHEVLKDD